MKKKFFLKNLAVFLILMLIPITLLGAYSIFAARKTVTQDIEKSNLLLLNQTNEIINNIFDTLNNLRMSFEVDGDFREMLNTLLQNPSDNFETLETLRILKNVIDTYPTDKTSIQSIYLFLENPHGAFINTIEGFSKLDSFDDSSWYESYMQNKQSRGLWSEPRDIIMSHYNEAPLKVVSVYKKMNPLALRSNQGAIVVNIHQARINNKLSDLPEIPGQYIFVTDEAGNVLFFNQPPNGIPHLDVPSIISKGSGTQIIHPGMKSYIATVKHLDRNNWNLITLVPGAYAYQLSGKLTSMTMVAIVLSASLAILFALYLTGRNYKYVNSIVTILQSAEKGKPLPPLPERVKDEYGYIIHNILKTFIEQSFLKTQLDEKKYRLQTLELIALQTQINPHFVFNTLKTIYWKSIKVCGSPGELSHMVENLSDILYYSLGNPDNKVTIADEIRNCKSYIEIQKIRYDEKFDVIWDYSESLSQLKVIKLILQPIIENSIYHGIKEKEVRSLIKIKVFQVGHMAKISIIDTGLGIKRDKLEDLRHKLEEEGDFYDHIGLFNTNKRLKLAYGSEYGIKIRSTEGRGTVIYISIPVA